ncbi:type II toxin-antitoxin system Phd/YefM family antitoxin [Anaerosporobacter sp.]|uniref:type II toxin-antitoxin system Phd/YefM family antitoxin n=1 Tax=Anaerosporobacter sp. TaxID=1872529 RepID=UPI00286F2B05|nr:type II toxin-antitoxin system prevent-host-death family antitoxin [Anaerosporobacter sp.]
MIAAKPIDVRARMKEYMDLAYEGEPVIVSRKQNRNVVIVSEQEYNSLQKAKRNAEYLAKLNESFAQLERGEVVVKTWEELEQMANE